MNFNKVKNGSNLNQFDKNGSNFPMKKVNTNVNNYTGNNRKPEPPQPNNFQLKNNHNPRHN